MTTCWICTRPIGEGADRINGGHHPIRYDAEGFAVSMASHPECFYGQPRYRDLRCPHGRPSGGCHECRNGGDPR